MKTKLNQVHLVGQIVLLTFLLPSCNQEPTRQAVELDYASLDIPDRPNILWLVTEDLGHYLAPFGDSTAYTPNINRLASEGVVYPNFFSPSGVCAPSRAAIALGMYPSGVGANHMRTTSYTEVTGLPAYEAVPPPDARMMSEQLRIHGYYCTNNAKKDYQFKDPVTAWDESGNFAHWRNRKENQPFFSIFNFVQTHESGLFEPYGFRRYEFRHYDAGNREQESAQWQERLSEQETPKHLPMDTEFKIPPYLPDTDVVRRDMWKMYNNISEMDRQLGAILDQLEEDGLLESTIIFFYGDHGGPLPRQKRLIYDSGLRTPLIVRYPNQQLAGTKDEQLLSFIDLAPTVMSAIGMEPPSYVQGQAFLGSYKATHKRKYIHAAADRFDGFTDAIRAVRDGRFKYIRNYRPDQGYYLPVVYRERIPTMQELLRLKEKAELNEYQAQWFRTEKPTEELFDCIDDPHELNNLADDPAMQDKLKELRKELELWTSHIEDQPNLPEKDLITQLWDGSEEQPFTASPQMNKSANRVVLSCETEGASIGFKLIHSDEDEPSSWSVYHEGIELNGAKKLLAQSHRIGYKASEVVEFTFE